MKRFLIMTLQRAKPSFRELHYMSRKPRQIIDQSSLLFSLQKGNQLIARIWTVVETKVSLFDFERVPRC